MRIKSVTRDSDQISMGGVVWTKLAWCSGVFEWHWQPCRWRSVFDNGYRASGVTGYTDWLTDGQTDWSVVTRHDRSPQPGLTGRQHGRATERATSEPLDLAAGHAHNDLVPPTAAAAHCVFWVAGGSGCLDLAVCGVAHDVEFCGFWTVLTRFSPIRANETFSRRVFLSVGWRPKYSCL